MSSLVASIWRNWVRLVDMTARSTCKDCVLSNNKPSFKKCWFFQTASGSLFTKYGRYGKVVTCGEGGIGNWENMPVIKHCWHPEQSFRRWMTFFWHKPWMLLWILVQKFIRIQIEATWIGGFRGWCIKSSAFVLWLSCNYTLVLHYSVTVFNVWLQDNHSTKADQPSFKPSLQNETEACIAPSSIMKKNGFYFLRKSPESERFPVALKARNL